MAIDFFPPSASGTSIAEQAAAWLLEFEDGALGDAERRAFVNWLKRSPVHIEEFLQISALHRQVERSVSRRQASLEEILAEVRTPVVPIQQPVARQRPAAAAPPRRRRFPAIAAGVAALAVGVLAAVLVLNDRSYSAGVGEQRAIMLEDGSVITLNTLSEVEVEFTEGRRHATLVRGEALFDIARDPERPFSVDTGSLNIQVLGTRFNVYRRATETTVTVLEGNVRVEPAIASSPVPGPRSPVPGPSSGPDPEPRTLTSGQQLVVTDEQILQRPRVDLERATAWTSQRLIFEQEPLSRVLEEFNRYNRRKLVLDDPHLASRKVTGVFRVHDLDVLISFLRQQHDLRIEETRNQIQIIPAWDMRYSS